jgi:hypothetical protein
MADDTSTQDVAPWWAWAMPWSAAAAGRTPWFGVAPQSLTQPINPGWSFGNVITVNSVNSSAPDVEREVVSRHSYGRQIGRLMDAVAALAEALPITADDERITEFRALAAQVEQIKKQMAPQRMERLRQELEQIKRNDKVAWAELRELLR